MVQSCELRSSIKHKHPETQNTIIEISTGKDDGKGWKGYSVSRLPKAPADHNVQCEDQMEHQGRQRVSRVQRRPEGTCALVLGEHAWGRVGAVNFHSSWNRGVRINST